MEYSGKKVLIMGLGLHGGGLESARFLLKRGADVAITDLRDEITLRSTIEQLDSFCAEIKKKPLRYVLGKHEIEDFKNADIVIKNPGVRPDSPFLQEIKQIETDISLFLTENPARLFAVTGTKGKSAASSALYWILKESSRTCSTGKKAYLGGNITVSPLSFLEELTPNDDVVLELSSFQLGDLRGRVKADGSPLLKPAAAVLTAIMEDHLDRYPSMEVYIDDKRIIYRGQDSSCVTVAGDDDWGNSFLRETKGRPIQYSFANTSSPLLPEKLLVPGEHQKINLLAAALAAYECGVETQIIQNALTSYKGVEHRIEFFHEAKGVRFYNDSAATIPEAAAACVEALSSETLVLVTGGTDKNLDFSPLLKTLVKNSKKTALIVLLAGTGSEKFSKLLDEAGIAYSGPFDDLNKATRIACEKAVELAAADKAVNTVLSPGCASFGMFLNEFDRGKKWKEAVLRYSNEANT